MDVIEQINQELATLPEPDKRRVLAYINAIQRSKGQAPPPTKSSGKTLTLKQFRLKHKLSQKALAEVLCTTARTLSMYESGRWVINEYIIDKIKELYGENIRPVKG
jgi:DNA-binding XRE family transcriptional regulator